MMRPFTAIGAFHERRLQLPAAVTIGAPVSPSKPLMPPPLETHTTVSFLPSVDVEIGPVLPGVPPAHQATFAVGGEPGLTRSEIRLAPLTPVHMLRLVAVITTWTPVVDV